MGKLILVVDDSITVCKILQVSLQRVGYDVVCCYDGVVALQLLNSPGVRIPDLIFVDLCLPKLDGYDVIQRLRAKNVFSQIPLVIITRRNGMTDRLKAKLVGAKAYLTKPFKTDDLLSVVEHFCPNRGGIA